MGEHTGRKIFWNKIKNSKASQVMSITSVGMGITLLLDILIAARFGTTETADSLIIALLLPLFLDNVSRESTKYSLIPIFIQYKEEQEFTDYNSFISGLINLLLVITLILSGIVFFLAPHIISIIGPGLSEEAIHTSSSILIVLIPLIIVLPVISILSANLNSNKKFNIVAIRNLIIPTIVIFCMVISWSSDITYMFVALGYSLGFALYGFVLWSVAKNSGYTHTWWILSSTSDLKKIRAALSWPTMGFMIRQSGRVAEKSIASVVGIGGVSGYYYGYRFYSAIQTIVGTSVATTSLPDLSMEKNAHNFKKMMLKSISIILFISIPIAVISATFSEQIIHFVFSRGNFDIASIEQTSVVLFWLSFGIIFSCMLPLLNSALYARKRFKIVFLNMSFLTFTNIILGIIFTSVWGLGGLAISVSVTSFIGVVILMVLNSYSVNRGMDHE